MKENQEHDIDHIILPIYKKRILTLKLNYNESKKIIKDIVENKSKYKLLQLYGNMSRENPFALFAFSKGDNISKFLISEQKLEKLIEVFNEQHVVCLTGLPKQWNEKVINNTTIAYPVFGALR